MTEDDSDESYESESQDDGGVCEESDIPNDIGISIQDEVGAPGDEIALSELDDDMPNSAMA